MIEFVDSGCRCTETICPHHEVYRYYDSVDSTAFYSQPPSEYDKAAKRKSARKSFSRFVNPKPKKNVDHYSHPAQRR